MPSSLYRQAVDCEMPEPWPGRRRSGLSRNQARRNFACCQQVRARVPFLVPSSARCFFSRFETLSMSWSGTSRVAR